MTIRVAINGFGRIGRKNNQKDYTIRIRDNDIVRKVFLKENFKMEVENMNTCPRAK